MLQYIPPDPTLSAVDERWHDLADDVQDRVAELMLTVASIPMTLAIDAVLTADDQEDTRDAEMSRADSAELTRPSPDALRGQ